MNLYNVTYNEWKGDLSGFNHCAKLSVGENETDAIERIRQLPDVENDARNFVATKVENILGYEVVIKENVDTATEIFTDFSEDFCVTRRGKMFIRNLSSEICEIFEGILERYDITIPSEDREGEESEARLFGSEYVEAEDGVTSILYNLCRTIQEHPLLKINSEDY